MARSFHGLVRGTERGNDAMSFQTRVCGAAHSGSRKSASPLEGGRQAATSSAAAAQAEARERRNRGGGSLDRTASNSRALSLDRQLPGRACPDRKLQQLEATVSAEGPAWDDWLRGPC